MNKMEDVIQALQDLQIKHEQTKSSLAMKRLTLSDKIEENFENMLTLLKRNRESELRMVENTLTKTEEGIKSYKDTTSRIIQALRRKTDASGTEMALRPADCGLNDNPDTGENDIETQGQELSLGLPIRREAGHDFDHKRNDADIKILKGPESELYSNKKTFVGFQPLTAMAHHGNLHYKQPMHVQRNENKSGTNISKFGNIKYSVKLHGTFNIRTTEDTNVSDINGICCFEDGRVVLVDTKNARLKVLDSDFNVINATENCDFIRAPFGICHLHDEKFVFTDNTRSFQAGCLKYISIDKTSKIKYIKAFSTGVKNWSVVSKGCNLYVIGTQKSPSYYHIKRYTKNGGAQLGGLTIKGEYMCFNSDKSTLYVTRGTTENKKSDDIVIVDHDDWFHERCSFWHPDLKVPCGVVVDEYDQIFVCGFASKNVVQFDKDGNIIAVLLEGEAALNGPKVLGYDQINHRLIVAGNANIIKVFDLKQ